MKSARDLETREREEELCPVTAECNTYKHTVHNKQCLKISQETLLNHVSNDLFPFMVRQSHDSFTLLGVKAQKIQTKYAQSTEGMHSNVQRKKIKSMSLRLTLKTLCRQLFSSLEVSMSCVRGMCRHHSTIQNIISTIS
jgi:hypothetical protein